MNARGRPLVAPTNLFFMVGKTCFMEDTPWRSFLLENMQNNKKNISNFDLSVGLKLFAETLKASLVQREVPSESEAEGL